MEKLPMCRICLAEDFRMYMVVNKDLHELYERLTHMPLVTGDIRPMLACSFCCAELKRSCRLLRRCLEAEELFAQIMNGNYKPKPLINQDHFRFPHGFIISPIQNINIVEVGQTESVVVKEELPAVCERQDDILEPKEEYQSDDLEQGDKDYSHLDILPHGSETDSEDDVPLIEFKIEEEAEQEPSKKKCGAMAINNLEMKNQDNSRLDVEDIPSHGSLSESGYYVPLMEYKIEEQEEQETPKEKCRAIETNRSTVAKEPKLHLRRSKSEDSIPADQKTNQVSDSTVIRTTRNPTSKAEYKKSHECDICLRNFNQKSSLNRHYRIHTGEKPYKCDLCQSSFIRNVQLTRHIRTHTGEKPYECDICQICFDRNDSLKRHMRTHTGEKPYKCDVCQICFSSNSSLRTHLRTHTGEKPYECDICQICFVRKDSLKRHIRTHTGENPYKCDICQHSFITKLSLIHHNRLHTGDKPYKCDVCQLGFSLKISLTNHMLIHTGEKPYECDICQICFVRKDTLKKHIIRTHTGKKPYKCDICQKSFSSKDYITVHMRTHSGEKPYKCDMCQKSFSSKGHLTVHRHKHTGEKPYKCDVCQICFSSNSSLRTHLRTHTGDKPYKCDMSKKTFKSLN